MMAVQRGGFFQCSRLFRDPMSLIPQHKYGSEWIAIYDLLNRFTTFSLNKGKIKGSAAQCGGTRHNTSLHIP